MEQSDKQLAFRPATEQDQVATEAIRQAAFAPVFASFKSILGDDIYDIAQAAEDDAQAGMLSELFDTRSEWELYVAELAGVVVGFLSIKLDNISGVGEIGLNAVHPDAASKGIGTKMYEFAIQRMREQGMKVATVATGGDPSHLPARNAYRKAGFDTEIPSTWMCKLLEQ